MACEGRDSEKEEDPQGGDGERGLIVYELLLISNPM